MLSTDQDTSHSGWAPTYTLRCLSFGCVLFFFLLSSISFVCHILSWKNMCTLLILCVRDDVDDFEWKKKSLAYMIYDWSEKEKYIYTVGWIEMTEFKLRRKIEREMIEIVQALQIRVQLWHHTPQRTHITHHGRWCCRPQITAFECRRWWLTSTQKLVMKSE